MPRNIGKKIALGFAWLCVFGTLASIVGAGTMAHSRGINDPITASLLATIVFFISCTVVLYVMSKPLPQPLEPWEPNADAERD